jgi:hypothetical protein
MPCKGPVLPQLEESHYEELCVEELSVLGTRCLRPLYQRGIIISRLQGHPEIKLHETHNLILSTSSLGSDTSLPSIRRVDCTKSPKSSCFTKYDHRVSFSLKMFLATVEICKARSNLASWQATSKTSSCESKSSHGPKFGAGILDDS